LNNTNNRPTAPTGTGWIDTGGGQHSGVPVRRPLDKDQEDHVDEQGGGEADHRYDFKPQTQVVTKVTAMKNIYDEQRQ
jgi:hypothetical protein